VLLALGDFPRTNPLTVIDIGVLKPLAIENEADASLLWRCSVVLTAVMSQQLVVPLAMEFWRYLRSLCNKQGGESKSDSLIHIPQI